MSRCQKISSRTGKSECVKCRKYCKGTQEQVMADLPAERVEPTPPFMYSGMDCFSPFYVKDGRKELKRYGLLFTYMCSRAVHIEVLDELSSDAFLNALRCFISIRGNVSQLHSDQGTKFVGAKKEFMELMKGFTQEHERSGLSFRLQSTFLQSHGRSLGATDPNSAKCLDSHLGSVRQRHY